MKYLRALFAGMCVCALAANASARHGGVNTSGGPSGTIDVKQLPYGAKGDGVTDDATSIQNAINASCAARNHPDVYFPVPSNCYKITTPIHVGCANIAVHGQEGPGQTKLCPTYWGPTLMDESSSDNLLEYGPALVGSGHSLNTKSFPKHGFGFITLNEALGNLTQPINGLGSFNIEFFWEGTTFAGSGNQYIFTSVTAMPGTPPLAGLGAFGFQLLNNTSLRVNANFRTSGNVTFADVPVTANTIYDISLDDNAGTCRLFLNGVLKETKTCTGTFVQGPYEVISLPAVNMSVWPDSNFLNNSTTGYIDAVHVQKASVHTSNYTPAVVKPKPTGNTLILINFDQPTTLQQGTQPAYIAGSSSINGYLSIHYSGSQQYNTHISYLELCGSGHPTGLFVNESPNSEFDHLSCSRNSYIGLDLNHGSFFPHVHDNTVSGGVICEYFLDATEGTVSNNVCAAGPNTCFVSNSSSYIDTFAECQNQNTPGRLIYPWVDFQSHIQHFFPFVDNEGAGAGLKSMFYIDNSYSPESIVGAEFGSTNRAPLLVQAGGGAPTKISEADFYVVGGTPTEVVRFTGTPPTGPDLLENNNIPAGVALSSNLAYIMTPDKPPTLTVRTLPACNALNRGQARDVTDCDSCVFGATCIHTIRSTFCRELCNGSAWVVQ